MSEPDLVTIDLNGNTEIDYKTSIKEFKSNYQKAMENPAIYEDGKINNNNPPDKDTSKLLLNYYKLKLMQTKATSKVIFNRINDGILTQKINAGTFNKENIDNFIKEFIKDLIEKIEKNYSNIEFNAELDDLIIQTFKENDGKEGDEHNFKTKNFTIKFHIITLIYIIHYYPLQVLKYISISMVNSLSIIPNEINLALLEADKQALRSADLVKTRATSGDGDAPPPDTAPARTAPPATAPPATAPPPTAPPGTAPVGAPVGAPGTAPVGAPVGAPGTAPPATAPPATAPPATAPVGAHATAPVGAHATAPVGAPVGAPGTAPVGAPDSAARAPVPGTADDAPGTVRDLADIPYEEPFIEGAPRVDIGNGDNVSEDSFPDFEDKEWSDGDPSDAESNDGSEVSSEAPSVSAKTEAIDPHIAGGANMSGGTGLVKKYEMIVTEDKNKKATISPYVKYSLDMYKKALAHFAISLNIDDNEEIYKLIADNVETKLLELCNNSNNKIDNTQNLQDKINSIHKNANKVFNDLIGNSLLVNFLKDIETCIVSGIDSSDKANRFKGVIKDIKFTKAKKQEPNKTPSIAKVAPEPNRILGEPTSKNREIQTVGGSSQRTRKNKNKHKN